MSPRIEQLAQKRRDLQLRCAFQRQEVAQLTAQIEAKLVTADRVIEVVTGVAKSPLMLIAISAGAMFVGPWRLLRWVSQGSLLFSLLFSGARKIHQLVTK